MLLEVGDDTEGRQCRSSLAFGTRVDDFLSNNHLIPALLRGKHKGKNDELAAAGTDEVPFDLVRFPSHDSRYVD